MRASPGRVSAFTLEPTALSAIFNTFAISAVVRPA